MENLKRLTELSRESGVPESTIRRWIESFHHYFTTKKIGKTTYYRSEAIDLLKRLKTYYREGKNADEIEEILSVAIPKTITVDPENPPPGDPLPDGKDSLFLLVEKTMDQRKEIQFLAVQLLKKDEEVKGLRDRIAAVEVKEKEVENLKDEIVALKETIDLEKATVESLRERIGNLEAPPKESLWQAWKRMWKRPQKAMK